MLQRPHPVQVLDLFAPERAALLDLLAPLAPDEWERTTACANWSVKDVALHILGGDLGNLSRRRDGFMAPAGIAGEDLVAFVNRFNEEWVQAARRLSPQVLCELLGVSGPRLFAYFATLDLAQLGGAVSWAGRGPAPVWLDVAREYTERWLHQQHIRDAVGQPGLTDRRFLGPVLAAFVFALPPAFQATAAPPGTAVQIHIAGEAGGDWALGRDVDGWTLYTGIVDEPTARIDLNQDIAWRLFTKGMTPEEAERRSTLTGDRTLARQALHAVAIIA